jgi:transcription-repair coupling factor (superfamily II helicase)
LFCPPISTLTADARKRLKTIEEHSDLGSGFEIAMRDLDIRGAGNLLGGEQSGFINEIGYETYQKVLEEAILELKESTFKDLFKEDLEKKKLYVRDVTIDTDVEMLIPDEYVSNIQERLNLYTSLNKIDTEEGIQTFKKSMIDRFGKMPKVVNGLFDGLRLRWISKELGFERIILKNGKLRCYFVENPQSPYYESPTFQKIFQFIAMEGHKHGLSVKKSPRHLILVKDGIRSLGKARQVLQEIEKGIL